MRTLLLRGLRALWPAARTMLGLAGVLALATALSYRHSVREARRSFEMGAFSRAAVLLRPWFSAGVLGLEPTQILMQALLASGGDPLTAAAAGQACIQREPRAIGCAAGISDAFLQLGRPGEAEQVLQRTIDTMGSQPQIHLRWADLAARTNRESLAIAHYQGAVNGLSGDDRAFALTRFVQYLNERKRSGDASRFVQELFDLTQGKAVDGVLAAAETWLQMGKDDEFLRAMGAAQRMLRNTKSESTVTMNNQKLFDRYSELQLKAQHPKIKK